MVIVTNGRVCVSLRSQSRPFPRRAVTRITSAVNWLIALIFRKYYRNVKSLSNLIYSLPANSFYPRIDGVGKRVWALRFSSAPSTLC